MLGPKRARRPHYEQKEIDALLEPIFLLASDTGREGGPASSHDTTAPVIRAIASSRQRDAFVSSLSSYIAQKDSEIERVCRDNYSEFLTSTDKLLKVRKGTVNLRNTLSALNSQIQEKGNELADAKRDLLETGRVASNIDESVQTLQACLRVLDLANKINRLITVDKNYYAALRSLDDLLAIHIKPLLQFGFAQHMLQTLPLTKLQIRAEVTTEFKSWLFNAREAGKDLGRKAIEQYEKRARRWRERGVGTTNAPNSAESHATLSKTPLNGPVEVGVSEKYEYNSALLDDQESKIGFKPLYQCIHIYDTLDALEDLQKSYQADRSSQASLILSESQSIQPFSLDVLSRLLEEIVGFFIIESFVLSSTSTAPSKRKIRFRTPEQVGELWTMMSERLAHVITSGLGTTDDTEIHLATKGKLLSTVQTLQGFGYSTLLLNEILEQFMKRYASLLSKKFEPDFRQIVAEDDNQPMRVENEDERSKVLDVTFLPLDGPWSLQSIKSMPFPIDLPFSPTYPLCCMDIRNMIAQFRQFSEGATTLQAGDALLREALDNLIKTSIVDSTIEKIRNTFNLPGLAQIISNLEFLDIAADQISSHTLTVRGRLDVHTHIATALKHALVKIVSTVCRQLDGFFEDARYDWTARRPPQAARGGEEEPSGFLLDMVNYLSLSMDNQLASLSPANRNEVYRGALKHCANALMALFTDKNPARISEFGLAHFAVDVRFMSVLASNLPEEGLDEVFAELSQLIALLESPTPGDYLDKDLRQMAYPSVTAKRLHPIVFKLLSYYNSLDYATLSLTSRKKKTELENLLKYIMRASVPGRQSMDGRPTG